MADIKRVIKGLENCITGFDCPSECPYLDDCNDLMKPMFVELAKDALALLKEQPEIVRCKDCEYWNKRIRCRKHGDWFCAEGERRTD